MKPFPICPQCGERYCPDCGERRSGPGTVGDVAQGCKTSADCPKGRYCTAWGACIADNCHTNADCDPNYACFGGSCVAKSELPAGSECSVDPDCGVGRICENGYCVTGAHTSLDPETLCLQYGGTWDPVAKKCTTGTQPTPGSPPCSSGTVVQKVQQAVGASVDGKWGCASQNALDHSGMSYQGAAGGCSGSPPNPLAYCPGGTCQAGACVNGSGPAPSCLAQGANCGADSDCCNGQCVNNICGGGPSPAPTAQNKTLGTVAMVTAGALIAGLATWAVLAMNSAPAIVNPSSKKTRNGRYY